MNKNVDKFKRAIEIEKASMKNKIFSIDAKTPNKFEKASEFLDDGKTTKVSSKDKTKLLKNSLPEEEYQIVTDTIKILIDKGFITKPTEIFRIGLAILKQTNPELIIKAYENLQKITPGKPKHTMKAE